jgi:hypothetical protein
MTKTRANGRFIGTHPCTDFHILIQRNMMCSKDVTFEVFKAVTILVVLFLSYDAL